MLRVGERRKEKENEAHLGAWPIRGSLLPPVRGYAARLEQPQKDPPEYFPPLFTVIQLRGEENRGWLSKAIQSIRWAEKERER